MMRESFVTAPSNRVTDIPQEKIDEIARSFGEYLYLVGPPRTTSKHAALGAVGKTLRRARTVRGSALLGYARRVHEQQTQNNFAAGPAEKLDTGVRALDSLLTDHRSLASAILERIDYATYFDVKRRFVDLQRGWKRFVFENQKALGLSVTSQDSVPWLSKKLNERTDGRWGDARERYLDSLSDMPADESEGEE